MALAKIDEIIVYTCSASDPITTHELNAWFDHSGIEHGKLDYRDVQQAPEVLNAVNTWWRYIDRDTGEEKTQPPIENFPFVVYTEIHEGAPVSYLPRKYIQGKEDIIAQLPGLYSIGRE